MGIIQRPKRITSQDVSEESREAVTSIGNSVNTFMEESYITMMGNITISDNLNMNLVTFNVEVDSSGVPKNTVRFKSGITGNVSGHHVVNVSLNDPAGAPFITFTQNSGIVTVSKVFGLTADTSYRLVVLVIGK